MPQLGSFVETLEGWLEENKDKPWREKLTLIRLYEQLQEAGYQGGYDAVRRYARSWQRERSAMSSEVFVPLKFDPGE